MKHIDPLRLLVISFAGAIATGTVLLLLPFATVSPISFLDALFTATSAVCVTGLTVVSTGTTFTTFGQLVILILIQIGGLGILTYSTFFMSLFIKRLSLHNRDTFFTAFDGAPVPDLMRYLPHILGFVLVCEGVGALALGMRFHENHAWGRASFLGIFHAVSSFCNAGFSPFDTSLTGFQHDPWILLCVSLLIIVGGIGMVVMVELYLVARGRRRVSRLSLHARVVIVATLVLLAGGTLGFWLLESRFSLTGMPFPRSLLNAFFMSVNARTAGFNSVPIGEMSPAGHLFTMVLMFIGAAPASCGGGIKVTSMALILVCIIALVRKHRQVQLACRTVPDETILRAFAVFAVSMVLIVLSGIALFWVQQGHEGRPLELLFEIVSALGTVGLSTGITPALTPGARLVIIFVMFTGRIGALSISYALSGQRKKREIGYPAEHIMIG